MNRVVLSALFLLLIGVVSAQVGPQILYPATHDTVPLALYVSRAAIAAKAYSTVSSEGFSPVLKMTYRPPRVPGIREQIARKNAYDPVLVRHVDSQFAGRLVLARRAARGISQPATEYSPPLMRSLPTETELAGMANQNALHPPYGLGRDPIGKEFNTMPDGPADPQFHPDKQFLPFLSKPVPFATPGNPTKAGKAAAGAKKPALLEVSAETQALSELEAEIEAEVEAEEQSEESSEESEAAFVEAEMTVTPISGGAGSSVPALAETSSAIRMVKRLPEHVRAVLEKREKNTLSFPEDILRPRLRGERPVMVRKLGGPPLALVQKQEAIAKAKADAKAEAEAKIAAKEAAEAAEQATMEAERAAHEAEAEKERAEKEKAEAEARAEAERAHVLLEQAQKLEAEKNEARLGEELDKLAEAVAADTVNTQQRLVSKKMEALKRRVAKAAAEAKAEAELPWWERKSGKEQNERNAQASASFAPVPKAALKKMPAAAAPKVSLMESRAEAEAEADAEFESEAELDAEAEAEADADAEFEAETSAPTQPGYANIPELQHTAGGSPTAPAAAAPPAPDMAAHFLEQGAAASTAAPPMYHAYPPHSGQAVLRVKRVANPYAFTSMDLLYPKLRSVWGLSGFPARDASDVAANAPAVNANQNFNGNAAALGLNGPAPAAAAAAPAVAPASVDGRGNTIVINVAPGSAPAPVATTTTSMSSSATNVPESVFYPNVLPPANLAGPYASYYPTPYAPPASHMIHAGNPTPGTQLSDNNSFGQLKV